MTIRALVLAFGALAPTLHAQEPQAELWKLTAEDGHLGALFGWSVATADFPGTQMRFIAVGAPGERSQGEGSGAVYLYRQYESQTWTQIAKLTAPQGQPDDAFGYSVAIVQGDWIAPMPVVVVGAPGRYEERGAVLTFNVLGPGGVLDLSLIEELTPDGGRPGDRFGHSLLNFGRDTGKFLVGAPGARGTGAVYRGFSWTYGSWLTGTILPPEPEDARAFGSSFDRSGLWVIVGDPEDARAGEGAGAAWMFTYHWYHGWTARERLSPPTPSAGDRFGESVTIDNDHVVVGATGAGEDGAAYAYGLSSDETWQLHQEILPPPEFNGWEFSGAVSLRGERLVIGGYARSNQTPWGIFQSDSAWHYGLCGGNWTAERALVPRLRTHRDHLGNATALSENAAGSSAASFDRLSVVGSWLAAGRVAWTGAVYVFDARAANLPQPGRAFCFGDGSGAACPCSNEGGPGRGCAGWGGDGMTIAGCGSASLSADDLGLVVRDCPPGQPGLFLTGRSGLDHGIPLHGGLLCVGGPAHRNRAVYQTDGVASDTDFVAQGSEDLFAPGENVYFQYVSRTESGDACGTGVAFSPAYGVTMTP